MLMVLGVLFGRAHTVAAQEPTPSDDEVNAVARKLYCPVCENVPLDVCPTEACSDWREQIREKLAAGWTEEEIDAYFAAQYGDRVLAQPPRQGFNWLAYLVPLVLMLLGAAVVGRILWAARRSSSMLTAPMAEDEHLAEIEAALRKQGE
jgi:cytochrome c-type biogenesis protein CcmH